MNIISVLWGKAYIKINSGILNSDKETFIATLTALAPLTNIIPAPLLRYAYEMEFEKVTMFTAIYIDTLIEVNYLFPSSISLRNKNKRSHKNRQKFIRP